MSLYCGRKILPSIAFADGYEGIARTSATSPLSIAHVARLPGALLPFLNSGRALPASLPFLFAIRWSFRRMEDMLGKPNSSSSSSYPSCSLAPFSATAPQALSVSERKPVYVRRGGGEVVVLGAGELVCLGSGGGVDGRELDSFLSAN